MALRLGSDPHDGSRQTELIALILSIGWLVFVGAFFLFVPVSLSDGGFDPLRLIMVMLAIFLPVAVIWVASIAARSARVMQAETQRLHGVIANLQQEVAEAKRPSTLSPAASVERKMTKIAQASKKADGSASTFKTQRPEGVVQREEQPSLRLGLDTTQDAAPLPRADLIRALNFPDSEGDTVGFAALRKALKDHSARNLGARPHVAGPNSSPDARRPDISGYSSSLPAQLRPDVHVLRTGGER